MFKNRMWPIRLPLIAVALLTRPALADSVADAVDGFGMYVGCLFDGAAAGANMGYVMSFCMQYMNVFP